MAVDNWALLKSCGQAEMEKWRWCRGCKYLSSAGCSGCCDYLLITGKRRPCPIGNDCTVREYNKRYKPSDSHVAWCRAVDELLEAERIKAEQHVKERTARDASPVEKDYEDDEQKRHGKKPTWDIEYGFMLFQQGYRYYEIATILRVNYTAVAAVAHRQNWTWQTYYIPAKKHDLIQARKDYEDYRMQKERT